jgi:hypothetical protein
MTRLFGKGVVTLAAAAAFAVLPAAGASADLINTGLCDGAALSQPFAQFGDDAQYKLLPGGDFEGGALNGYSISGGAKVVAGNEPFGPGAKSLSIPAGGSVLTPATCVNTANPNYRFFYKSQGGLLGLLPAMTVSLVYQSGVLGIAELPLGVVLPSGKWKASGKEFTLAVLGSAIADGSVPLALRFTSVAGTWTVDDVYVDPAARR